MTTRRARRRRGSTFEPSLTSVTRDGIGLELDPGAPSVGVLLAFTDRRGGVSAAPYDSLNLALSVGDRREAVLENRRRAARAIGFELSSLGVLRQVHGADLVRVGRRRSGLLGEADGLVTRRRGPVLGLLAADCAPVALAGARGLALAHAGWRGLVAGILDGAAAAVAPVWAAWVGPCIRACCYEVGPAVIEAFRDRSLPVADAAHVDIADAARAALGAAGVDRVAVSPSCTGCDGRWFSHRRDGVTGRNGTFAALV